MAENSNQWKLLIISILVFILHYVFIYIFFITVKALTVRNKQLNDFRNCVWLISDNAICQVSDHKEKTQHARKSTKTNYPYEILPTINFHSRDPFTYFGGLEERVSGWIDSGYNERSTTLLSCQCTCSTETGKRPSPFVASRDSSYYCWTDIVKAPSVRPGFYKPLMADSCQDTLKQQKKAV